MDETHDKYLMLCRMVEAGLPDDSVILKTDCFNEVNNCGYFSAHETHYLEINPERAKQFNHPNLHVGDIRAIPFRDGFFDAVIDLSTNDHIPNPGAAIREYGRVLKPKGLLLIISWLSPAPIPSYGDLNSSDRQYWFLESEFREWLAPCFRVMLEIGFPEHTHKHCWLKGLLCARI